MDTKRELRRLRRHALPSAFVVGGVGLAAADVSAGIGWGLALVGAALAVHPPGPAIGARPRARGADR